MARTATLDSAAEAVKSAASAASTRARRAAHEGVRQASEAGETYRSVFHDLADEAERRFKQGEREAGAFGKAIAREATARPGLAIALVAATALVGGSLLGWALSRRR
jgi:hypothetical protein